MQILILVAFVLALTSLQVPSLEARCWLVGLSVGFYVAIAAAISRVNASLSLRTLRRSGQVTSAAARRHNLLGLVSRAWLLGGLGAVIILGYGRWVIRDLSLGRVPLAGEAAALAPFVAALLLTWAFEYPFYAEFRRRLAGQQPSAGRPQVGVWTLGEYLAYNTRHHLLFIAVPVGMIIAAVGALDLYVRPLLPPHFAQAGVFIGSAGAAGCVFLIAPLLIARIWRTEPLPAGELRNELEAFCRGLKLRYRDILIWHSGPQGAGAANAGVMGLVGAVRYILLSDALLTQMDRRHVKAIFAHEAAHIINHHILYAVIFVISVVFLLVLLGGLVVDAVAFLPDWAGTLFIMGLLAITFGACFGWISRRFERQSDVFGAWASGLPGQPDRSDGSITPEGAATFGWALQRVAQINGIPQSQHNWRHGSIARRISYVLWLGSIGAARGEVDRLIRRIKIGLWCLLVLAAAAVATAAKLGYFSLADS